MGGGVSPQYPTLVTWGLLYGIYNVMVYKTLSNPKGIELQFGTETLNLV